MKHTRFLACAVAFVAIALPPFFAAQDGSHAAAPSATGKRQHAPQPPAAPEEGQKIFQQNCSRCHAAPEGFSPRITGTIVRHMRVRANLSEHDERELLHFLNP